MSRVDLKHIEKIKSQIGETALDPELWPSIMADICHAVGAAGAALLQTDVRTPDIPRTAGVSELFSNYFAAGWHRHDLRAERGVPLFYRGQEVLIDQDVLTPEEMRRDLFYNEALAPFGFQWFAAIGFYSGSALWALAIQRTSQEGQFERNDQANLAQLSRPLTEAATLSSAVGRKVVAGMTSALSLVDQPALALNRLGYVVEMNEAAERIFDSSLRVVNRRLLARGREASAALNSLIDEMRARPDDDCLAASPIAVRRDEKPPLLIRALPISGAARSPFLGARTLLVISELRPKPGPQPKLMRHAFGLTAAEARLASLLAGGNSVGEAAERFKLSRETVRNQLKAIFAKTDTHRQSELVPLLSNIPGGATWDNNRQ